MRRLLPALVASAALLLCPAGAAAGPSVTAHSTPAAHLRPYDKQLLVDVNRARRQNGLKPYVQSDRLYRLAHKWAEHIVATRNLEHNPATFSIKTFRAASGCRKATTDGENVGEQGSTNSRQLFELYMSDPAHRDNNLSPKYNAPNVPGYTDVGIATIAVPNGNGTFSEVNVMDFANHCG
ncbi:MAG TPA: CAP domain-containing protein [Mycobacteriales bacterium]|nr:CAP domain-containing protein [Mycobacteriales bacterium]